MPDIDYGEISRKVSQKGIETLAYYRSYHWNPPEEWGIYILDTGLWFLANNVFQGLRQKLGFKTEDLIRLGLELLFFHEFFHFLTDIASTVVESALSFDQLFYAEYVRNVYLPAVRRGSAHELLEESLANAFAFKKINRSRTRGNKRYHIGGLLGVTRKFMRSQPDGYKQFEDYLTKHSFSFGRGELGKMLTRCKLQSQPGWSPLEILLDTELSDIFYFDVPVRIVPTITDSRYAIHSFSRIKREQLIETPQFINRKKKLLARNGQLQAKYDKQVSLLGVDLSHRGLGWERRYSGDNEFAFRLDDNYRVIICQRDDKFELTDIGDHKNIDQRH